MPGPFPGMDPYLEHRAEWRGFHQRFITYTAEALEKMVLETYWDYLVSLHRPSHSERFEVWAFTVRQRLPRVRVPLTGDDPDVVLDLQAVFDRCYDAAAYARSLDYRQPPVPPLRPADAEWADALLREKGLRKQAEKSAAAGKQNAEARDL